MSAGQMYMISVIYTLFVCPVECMTFYLIFFPGKDKMQ